MKPGRYYVSRSPATLTQSGLLAALLKHQRSHTIELARRRAQRERMHATFRSSVTRLLAAAYGITGGLRLRRDLAERPIPRRT